MMDAKELLLYLEREKQRKEANEEAQKSTSSKGSSSSKSSQNISNSSIEFEINVGSDDGKSFSSSSSASNSTPSIKGIKDGGSLSVQNNKANLINTPEVKLSETSGSVESIKIIDDGMKAVSSVSSKISSATSQAIPTISNFAIVKFTGADNFGKSAYTVGKKSSERMTTAIEYITRDGVYKEDGSMIIQRADGHIDYMIRDGVQDKGLDSDFRSGILYDKYGDILSIAHAKEMFGKDITGERRLVYSPNSNLKMNDSEFQKAMYRTLSDFGNDYHKNYDYISAIHRNTDNPHAHILMSTKDVGGEGIKMFKDELFELKMRFYENTQQIAENKKNNFEIQYNDKSHYSLAMQIGRFTGDVPGAEFANQNIYLAEKIAKKYNLNFDEKAMQKDTENVKKFFEENKDKYNEFLTNAKNRYADTFTKFSKDASELSEKYNLGAVPKDMDGFKDFLQKNQKLFLADKIAAAKDIEITSKDVKNLTMEIKKDDNGELTREGRANIKKSMQWFDKNEAAVKEWNQENKGRMSKELFNRLENLNERVDSQFEMPKDRMGAITLNHHYKIDPMAFANDTRKALIDVVEARVDYFKKEYKGKNLTKDEYKTNLSRLGGLRDRIKAFDDVTVGSLKKYGIDTSFFASHEKTIELDGIKLDDIGASNKFSMLIESELNNELLSAEEKKKLENIYNKGNENKQISISALENIGFKREDLEKTFNVEKIEAKLSIVDFKTTEIGKDTGTVSIDEWKSKNLKDYEFVSTVGLDRLQHNIDKSIKSNNELVGKNVYLDKTIEYVNSNLQNISNNASQNKGIFKNLIINSGLDTSKLNFKTIEKEVEIITKGEYNDNALKFLFDKKINDAILDKYSKNSLTKQYFEKVLEYNGIDRNTSNALQAQKTITDFEFAKNPTHINMNGETVSQYLFQCKNFIFDKIKNELSNEHGVEIKSVNDLSANLDKIGTQNPIRTEFANKLELMQELNNDLKGDNNFINKYIDMTNNKIESISQKIVNGKQIRLDEFKSLMSSANIETYKTSYEVDYISNNKENINKVQDFLSSNKDIFDDRTQANILNDLEKGELKKHFFDGAISQATQKSDKTFDINFKPSLETTVKIDEVEYVKIGTLSKILDENITENITHNIMKSDKFFNKIKNELSNEHGVEIKSVNDLSANLDKIGTQSALRNLITKTTQYHLSSIEQTEENQKDINNLNSLITKNNGLFPIFESDMRKIGANTIDFIDKSATTIKVEVVPNNDINKENLLNVFGKMINESTDTINSIQINDTDRLALNTLNEETRKKLEFKELANEYIKNDAIDSKQALSYVSALLDNRTLSSMSYLIEKNKIEDVPKNFLEARNIDTSIFEIEEKDKEVHTITMGSTKNYEQFKEFLSSNNLEHIITQESLLVPEATKSSVYDNYQNDIDAFITQHKEIDSANVNEFNTLLFIAVEDKNISMVDTLYKLDIESKNDGYLLEIKFESYAAALDISREDVYGKMLNKYFNLDESEISQLSNLEKTFDAYLEFSNDKSLDDVKHKLYIETLSELVNNKYEQYAWEHFDMSNENVSELNMKSYFESIQDLIDDSKVLNEFISHQLETKELYTSIEELINDGNIKQAQEMLNDEKVDGSMRVAFEYLIESVFNNENIIDEVYEKVIDSVELREKTYEIFKDELIEENDKIEDEEKFTKEFLEVIQQESLDEEKDKEVNTHEETIEEDLTGKKVLAQEEMAIEQEEVKSKDMGMGM